jgi:NADH-quinone oxidoreductase subunit A
MGFQLLNVLTFTLFGIAFVVVVVAVLSRLLRPRVEDPAEPAKAETYECGEPTIGSSWVRFDIRFYTIALIFLIFDVEVAFLYPWALIFQSLRSGFGLFIFLEVLLFLGILLVGFLYCWRKGDLDWMKLHAADAARRVARESWVRAARARAESEEHIEQEVGVS